MTPPREPTVEELRERPPIISIKPGSLSGSDKAKLTKAGYVVVECHIEDGMKIMPGIAMPVDTLGVVHAALKALSNSEWARNEFGRYLVKAMLTEIEKP